jgi:Zn-dependent protease with chaperone function
MIPLELLLLLATGVATRTRDLACRLSNSRWIQGAAFLLLLLLALEILSLPVEIWWHRTALVYGLSVQGWANWLADKVKLLAVAWIIGTPFAVLLFWVIGKSPRKWWFWFWIASSAVVVLGVFASPYVFDPLFNRFEPLGKTDPALVARLERVAARGGLSIPPERMFLMKASAKSTQLNAYVTGFGASKRVVVWDTTIAKSSPDEIAFIFAHEMGHYALGHVVLGTSLQCVALLPLFLIGYYGLNRLLARYSTRLGIASPQDWAALVPLALILTSVSTLADPLTNGFSRAIEHEADVYGQEALHGILEDPQGVGARSFQVLGQASLDDPTPHPVFEWWFDTHPPIWFRTSFAAAYDPWRPGEHAKYFAK